MFCPECGEIVEDGERFCPNCGAVLGDDEMSGSPAGKPKKKTSIGVIIAIIAAVLLIGGGILLFVSNQDSKKDTKKAETTETKKEKKAKVAEADKDIDESSKEDKDAEKDKDIQEDKTKEAEPKKEEVEEPKPATSEPESTTQEVADMPAHGFITREFDTYVASSYLPGDEITPDYGPGNAFDKRPDTAWNEGSPGNGTGEWIEFYAYQSQLVRAIEIMCGYPKGEDIYERNCRPKDITISFDSGENVHYTLADKKGQYQRIVLPKPRETRNIRITINSVYQGTQYNDCCIAEIEVE